MILLTGLFSVPAQAQPTQAPPHMPGIDNAGIIAGEIFVKEGTDKKIPVADQTVTIIVYQGGEQVLTLDKKTDADGKFLFKNIIRDPGFSYEFGTMYDKDVYIYPKTQLAGDEVKKTLLFVIGKDSPYKINMDELAAMQKPGENVPANMMPPPAGGVPHANVSEWDKPFKIYTIILSVLVVMLAGYYLSSPVKSSNVSK